MRERRPLLALRRKSDRRSRRATFAEAEKLVQFELKADERQEAADTWRKTMAALYERRTGARKFAPDASTAPATFWNPMLPRLNTMPSRDRFVRSQTDRPPLPANDAEIAYAPLARVSRWIESLKLTSERLTHILSGAHRAVRVETGVHNYPDAGPGIGAGQESGMPICRRGNTEVRCTGSLSV